MKALCVFFVSLLIVPVLLAQIPRTISYQGLLTDDAGTPKPDGNYNFNFSLYVTSSGGNKIWSESKTLNVSKGLFSTSLGDSIPFGVEVKFDKPYWLGIKVGSDPELSPRIALTSAGYSLTSDNTLNIVDGKVVKSLNTLKDNVTLQGDGGTTVTTVGNTIIISGGGGGTGIQGVQNTNNTIDITNPNGPTATLNLKVPLTIYGNLNSPNYLFTGDVYGTGGGLRGTSTNGLGVVGQGLGTAGINYGVAGNSYSPQGFGVSGWNLSTTGDAIGIVGRTNSPNGIGINGIGGLNGIGVVGKSLGTSGVNYGVAGNSSSPDGFAVSGWNLATTGNAIGVSGRTESPSGVGVRGSSSGGIGVWGSSGTWQGVYGESNTGNAVVGVSTSGNGVYGVSNTGHGVRGVSSSTGSGAGVIGFHSSSSAIYGALGTTGKDGVYGTNGGGNTVGWAGFFYGRVYVVGDFFALNKNFIIDHPLDPENKYLIHSSVESSERMNIYNGNVVTDGNGFAQLELPAYFQSLNIEYRYQLTVIGQFAQAIIENEISQNRFTIKTDKPNVKVSWQVTGIRNDEYAKQNPFIVEKEKEDFAKGKYLVPKLFGQPEEMGIHYVKTPEIDQPQLPKN